MKCTDKTDRHDITEILLKDLSGVKHHKPNRHMQVVYLNLQIRLHGYIDTNTFNKENRLIRKKFY
jgi:hypothetical protein